MAKRLVAKTGEYTDSQGQTKGEYTRIGVILSNDNGEYALLDPTVNLAGVLTKQNMMSHAKGAKPRDMVMVSVFTDEGRQQGNGGGYGGSQGGQGGGHYAGGGIDDDSIPFAPIM